jgi:hypothetical protein
MQLLYRFRRTEALLGKYKELEKQEIYFPSPDELNDPVEGFKDMFWRGDEIVWKNLIKHYLLCLESVCETFLIDGDNFVIAPANIPVFKTASDFPTPAYQGLYQEICELFFRNELAARWSQHLASRAGPIRQNELYAYLWSMHMHALNTIFTVYETHDLMPRRSDDDPLRRLEIRDVIGVGVNCANRKEAERPEVEDGIERLHATTRHLSSQGDLIAMYNAPTQTIAQKNRRMLYARFPEEYLKSLERLVHPPWYTATFTGNYNNPSVWGHYGDGHTGVCLKFRATSKNGEPHLRLHGVDYKFWKIKYAKKYPEIDFFRSLGVLPIPALNRCWYFDEDKNKSSCADNVYDDVDAWRKSYWETFHEGITTKLLDWAYEDEYRLVHTPGEVVIEKSRRKLRYEFSDLQGIVFGIRTPEDAKSDIIRIIEEKCRSENRTDFKFYQAFYSRKDAHVDAAEMLLTFNQSK